MAMILYAAEKGKFIEFADAVQANRGKKCNIYVNITNKCNCSCTFCLRNLKKMQEGHSLWLKQEPDIQAIRNAFAAINKDAVNEVAFCGFGEPTMRLETLLYSLRYVRSIWPEKKTRLNTNGLASLYYKKDIAPLFKGLLDVVSISLNASNAKAYLELTRTPLGLQAYGAMLDFAKECKLYVPEVVMTIVDSIGAEEIQACKKVCSEKNLKLRIRPYEAN